MKKSKVKNQMEDSLAECMKVLVPIAVVGLPVLVISGFVIIQLQNMFSGDWTSFTNNIWFLGGMVTSYILGSAPKEGLLTKYM
jgi:hypothetical protein